MANLKGKGRGPRKSKAEAMTGAGANSVEVRTVGIGDNSLNLPAPDDYEHHMRSIRGLKEKSATAASLLRHAKTSANKACPGLAASIEETLAIEREGDPVKLQKRLNLLGMGLKTINSTIQLSVFDSLGGEVTEQAYKRGYADGENGVTASSRMPEGSDLDREYMRGWNHGTGKNMGQTPEQVDAALSSADAADELAAA